MIYLRDDKRNPILFYGLISPEKNILFVKFFYTTINMGTSSAFFDVVFMTYTYNAYL